jgi:hypothetical protein
MITGAVLAVIAVRIAAVGRFDQVKFPLLLACVLAPTLLPARLGPVAAIVPITFALGLWIMCRKANSCKRMPKGRPAA